MGNVVKQTLAAAELPSPANSPITETSFGAESLEDSVYSITTTTRYNAAGPRIISPWFLVRKNASGYQPEAFPSFY